MKNLLIVVDYQNDFVDKDGKLYVKNSELLEGNIAREIKLAVTNKDTVIFLKDTHDKDYMATEEGRHLPYPHTIKGTFGHELYGKIYELSKGHTIIEKNSFGSRDLGLYLDKHHFDNIRLTGIMTNLCVITNALVAKTFNYNAHIIVIKDCVGCGDIATDEILFDVMKTLQIEIK